MKTRQVWVKALVPEDSESSAILRSLEAKGRAEHVANDFLSDTDKEADEPVEVWIVDPDIVNVIRVGKVADPEIGGWNRIELKGPESWRATATVTLSANDLHYLLNGLAVLDQKQRAKLQRAWKRVKAKQPVRDQPSSIACVRADIQELHTRLQEAREAAQEKVKGANNG